MAKGKPKIKLPASPIIVPQNREQASKFLATIGATTREIQAIDADATAAMAFIREAADAKIVVLKANITALTAGLQTWCEANRTELTNGNKVKFADLGAGIVRWVFQRAAVTVKGEKDAVDWIIKAGRRFKKFVRVKVTINREAMLDDVALATTIPGVSIGSDGEAFMVEPFEAAVAEAAA